MAQSKRPEMEFEEFMSDGDSLMWKLETDPSLRSTIVSCWLLDRTPDLARFERTLEQATYVIPRLRQRVVVDPIGIAPPRWEEDPDFDLRFHFRRTRVPSPGTIRDVLDLAQPIAMQAFDKDRPLWEFYLVDGLEGGRCAGIMKLHHAISDGVGLVKMTECLIERGPDDVRETKRAPRRLEKPALSSWDRVTGALSHRVQEQRETLSRIGSYFVENGADIARSPLESLQQLRDTVTSAGRMLAAADEPMSPLMRNRSTRVRFETLQVPLAELKAAGKAAGGTVNDAFVAGVAGGLAQYHKAFGQPVDALRMMMPVNIRSEQTASRAGNEFAPARFEVPVGIENPAARIRAIGRGCRAQRDEPGLPWMEQVAGVLGTLPTGATLAIVGAMQKTTDFTTSNVPGPRRTTWMSGAQVLGFMPFGPLSGAAANFTVFSYNGQMHIGINMDPAAISDPALLRECLDKSFADVLALAVP